MNNRKPVSIYNLAGAKQTQIAAQCEKRYGEIVIENPNLDAPLVILENGKRTGTMDPNQRALVYGMVLAMFATMTSSGDGAALSISENFSDPVVQWLFQEGTELIVTAGSTKTGTKAYRISGPQIRDHIANWGAVVQTSLTEYGLPSKTERTAQKTDAPVEGYDLVLPGMPTL